jgi:acetyl esterase/lipase
VGFSLLAALSMSLLFCLAANASAVTPVTEQYGIASDGTPLHWVVYTPSTPGPWPAVIVIHGGGFHAGSPNGPEGLVNCAEDLAAAGMLALSIEYRLAPPGGLPGQKSAGLFPDQAADVQLAIRTARSDSRCNGKVGAVGGSAGGHHAALAACTGTPGLDRADAAVALSGPLDLTDFSPNPGVENFTRLILNFTGATGTGDTATLRAASPAWLVDKNTTPLFLVNTLEDSVPYSQLPDMISHLDAAGLTNYQALSLPGDRHSFAFWSDISEHAVEFLTAALSGQRLPSPSPTPTPGLTDAKQLLNVSTRADVTTGDSVMIGGFIVTGDNAKRVVLRGLGPSLGQSGVSVTLSNPVLQLFDSAGVLVESNDDWNLPGLPSDLIPKNPKESVLIGILPAGSYTAVLSNAGGADGAGLFELYDTDPSYSRISNISTRGEVGTGADVIIGGFIVGGTEPTRVIARALGPSLSSLGVAGALADPVLYLFDGDGNLIASNDNWRSTQEETIINTSLPPPDNREAAVVASLVPGDYTAIVSGAGGSTGVGLVEVYDLDE